MALGSYTPLMMAQLKLRIPVYPVKGYSITLPIVDAARAPESTIMDETHKVAVTRLGHRIRVGGTAELAGYSLALREARRATLTHVVSDLFPGGGDLARAEFWCGLRPMTPDGTPIVGPTPLANLYLATGHGTLGWTMAAGTGRVIADLISGREPEIDLDGLDDGALPALTRRAALEPAPLGRIRTPTYNPAPWQPSKASTRRSRSACSRGSSRSSSGRACTRAPTTRCT